MFGFSATTRMVRGSLFFDASLMLVLGTVGCGTQTPAESDIRPNTPATAPDATEDEFCNDVVGISNDLAVADLSADWKGDPQGYVNTTAAAAERFATVEAPDTITDAWGALSEFFTMTASALEGGSMRDLKAPTRYEGSALPIVAIPTTAGTGSEATETTVITDSDSGEKMLCMGPSYLPSAAIVDWKLTLSMPPRLSADTGIDALTHAVEAYVSKKRNSFSDALAMQAIRSIGKHLRTAYHDGADEEARAAMMEAATLAGIAFSNSSVALVHAMSRPLGANFGVAHGMANAMLFAEVTEYSLGVDDARYAQCARVLGVAEGDRSDEAAAVALVKELHALTRELAVPTPRDFGIDPETWEKAIPEMARQAIASGSHLNNPRVPTAAEIESLYCNIYTASRP